MSRPLRVLLLWPGADASTAGNFGVPQLVLLGTYARARTGAVIEIRDLELERAMARAAGRASVSLPKLLDGDDGRGYDVIGLSAYSSFDHLKCSAVAAFARERYPEAVIMVGGYHPSARPLDYIFDGSPFDVCVVGEGERALVQVIESVAGGAPLRHTVLEPQAIDALDELPPSDWTLLSRYRALAPRIASQAQVYLSRGCPFDCAFCMERAKREVSWRPLSVERALGEIQSLHRFLDLRGWTLYFGDALFGMRKRWRRELLEALARAALPIEKYWLLIRVDLIEDEDLRLFAAANCGLGFGLESGDPGQLAIIRKSGRLDSYLDRMVEIAARAREHQVPWGANVICGHPGETRASMERSAAYLQKLFLQPGGTTGFLSVDPFRLYPGSPIDAERGHYEQRHGTRFHRPSWWQDGDPEFLSEWIDPSAELDYLAREQLQDQLLTPILRQIEANFAYRGPAREYFLRAIREQVDATRPAARLHYLDRYFAWQGYLGRKHKSVRERRAHAPVAELCRSERARRLPQVAELAQLDAGDAILCAILELPREQFVPTDELASSVRDVAIALDDSELATVSAMHAYARSCSLLGVGPGDRVLDLGAGTGYGSALLARLVGPQGAVTAVELDPALSELGRANTSQWGVRWICGDACDLQALGVEVRDCAKLVVGFALQELPAGWLEQLDAGAVIVTPLRDPRDGQLRLSRATHRGGRFEIERFDVVDYVPVRSPARPELRECETAQDRARRLPVLG